MVLTARQTLLNENHDNFWQNESVGFSVFEAHDLDLGDDPTDDSTDATTLRMGGVSDDDSMEEEIDYRITARYVLQGYRSLNRGWVWLGWPLFKL